MRVTSASSRTRNGLSKLALSNAIAFAVLWLRAFLFLHHRHPRFRRLLLSSSLIGPINRNSFRLLRIDFAAHGRDAGLNAQPLHHVIQHCALPFRTDEGRPDFNLAARIQVFTGTQEPDS
jgi:hypothetical protein